MTGKRNILLILILGCSSLAPGQPSEVIPVEASDGNKTVAVVRKPPGNGRFPAIIYLHGGLDTFPVDQLKALATGPSLSRFLAAGYVTVTPTFRSRTKDPLTEDALRDCLGVVDFVKKMPGVDPKSVVVWGTSGGGSLAIEIAGERPLAAIAVEEPASILLTGMFTKDFGNGSVVKISDANEIVKDPQKFYTPEVRKRTEAKIRSIQCPIFLAEGGVHPINRINNEIVIPEILKAGKTLQAVLYPGAQHGFTQRGTGEAAKKFFEDCSAFFLPYLATKPTATDVSLVK